MAHAQENNVLRQPETSYELFSLIEGRWDIKFINDLENAITEGISINFEKIIKEESREVILQGEFMDPTDEVAGGLKIRLFPSEPNKVLCSGMSEEDLSAGAVSQGMGEDVISLGDNEEAYLIVFETTVAPEDENIVIKTDTALLKWWFILADDFRFEIHVFIKDGDNQFIPVSRLEFHRSKDKSNK